MFEKNSCPAKERDRRTEGESDYVGVSFGGTKVGA